MQYILPHDNYQYQLSHNPYNNEQINEDNLTNISNCLCSYSTKITSINFSKITNDKLKKIIIEDLINKLNSFVDYQVSLNSYIRKKTENLDNFNEINDLLCSDKELNRISELRTFIKKPHTYSVDTSTTYELSKEEATETDSMPWIIKDTEEKEPEPIIEKKNIIWADDNDFEKNYQIEFPTIEESKVISSKRKSTDSSIVEPKILIHHRLATGHLLFHMKMENVLLYHILKTMD